jgi:tRNA threonylcarbamoyladenosine modification (KEOPS) complex  Pcc1 subunit
MVQIKASINIEYQNQKQAEIITKSLTPDNKPLPENISIDMSFKGREVKIVVECICKIETFISTLDDILASICLTESLISLAEK